MEEMCQMDEEARTEKIAIWDEKQKVEVAEVGALMAATLWGASHMDTWAHAAQGEAMGVM